MVLAALSMFEGYHILVPGINSLYFTDGMGPFKSWVVKRCRPSEVALDSESESKACFRSESACCILDATVRFNGVRHYNYQVNLRE